MFMPLTDMKPDSQSHEHDCNPERQRWHLWPEEKRQCDAEYWGDRKIRASSSRTEISQGDDKKNQAHAVASEAREHGSRYLPDAGQMCAEKQRDA